MLKEIIDNTYDIVKKDYINGLKRRKELISYWYHSMNLGELASSYLPNAKKYTSFYVYGRPESDIKKSSINIIANPFFFYNNSSIIGSSRRDLCIRLRLPNIIKRENGTLKAKERYLYLGLNDKKLKFVYDESKQKNVNDYSIRYTNGVLKIFKKPMNGNKRLLKYELGIGYEKPPNILLNRLPDEKITKTELKPIIKKINENNYKEPMFKRGEHGSWTHDGLVKFTTKDKIYIGGEFKKDLSFKSEKIFNDLILKLDSKKVQKKIDENPLVNKIRVRYIREKQEVFIMMDYFTKYSADGKGSLEDMKYNKYTVKFKDGKIDVNPIKRVFERKKMNRFLSRYISEFADLDIKIIKLFDSEIRGKIVKSALNKKMDDQ